MSLYSLSGVRTLALATTWLIFAGCGAPQDATPAGVEDSPAVQAAAGGALTVAPRRPFPQHVSYTAGTALPNHKSQAQLDSDVRNFYSAWKAKFVTQTGTNQYYIHASTWQPDAVSVSEGHGYGMVITALMAGQDPSAQTIYDGMYRFFRAHPAYNTQLMGWYQRKTSSGAVVDGERYNATDGDLDIAYSLILADRQWGSGGAINYLAEAKNVIRAIMQADINRTYWTVMRGDTGQGDQSTRTSDYMLDHFRAFAAVSGDANWNKVVDKAISIITTVQSNNSRGVGLVPDFVVKAGGTPVPAAPNSFEGPDDGHYSWNACRVPWRLATDYALYGDQRVFAAVNQMNGFIRNSTRSQSSGIAVGYLLSGQPIDSGWTAMAFTAPFGVSATLSSLNQTWLNSLWDRMVGTSLNSEDYFGNNIKMIALLVMSGNYWRP